MALYRIYKVHADDHIADAENLECADDEEACAKGSAAGRQDRLGPWPENERPALGSGAPFSP